MADRGEIIRASEVGQYVFCARAWWLGKVLGYRPVNVAALQQGAQSHRSHGRLVERYHFLRRLAAGLLLLAAAVLIAWVLLSLGH